MLISLAGTALAQVPAEGVTPAPDQARRSNWVVTPSLRLAETYTDNIFLSPDGSQQSDWITQVIPGIAVTATGPRLRLNASYTPEIVYYAQTERDEKVFHRGYALGTLELADELLYLDAGGQVDQYDTSLQGPLTTSNVNITGNRSTVVTSYLSPYLRRNIGSAALAEARFTYTAWRSDQDQGALPDNTSRRVFLRLANGPASRLFTWDTVYLAESIDYDTGQKTTSEEFTASGERRITSTVSLLGLVGYERYDTGTEELSDGRWSAGFAWTPMPPTRFAVTAGQRLDDETYSLQFSHRTRLSAWNVTYAEDITTAREQFFVPATLSTATTLDQILLPQYPDPAARQKAVQDVIARTGLPASLGAPINFFSDQLFRQKRWLASAGLHGARNTLVGTASWEERKELQGSSASSLSDFVVSGSIRTSGATLGWALRLGARSTWNLEVGRQRAEFLDTGQVDHYAYLRAGVTRQFQPRVTGSLHYRLQAKDSTLGAAAEYQENTVVASLLMTF